MSIIEQATVLEKEFTGTGMINAPSNSGFTVAKDSTPEIISLVSDAADLIRLKGEAAFDEFRRPGSRWRMEDTYIFVLDPSGNMLVHADPQMEGRNQLALEDINGKPIIRGLLGAVTNLSDKREGWYHYQWPVPGGLLPRWKSSYVRLVHSPTGKSFIVGSGVYNDRMEREFVVDMVRDAVGQIEKFETASFRLFHDPKGPFMAKDAYIFVINEQGVDLVNPGFPNLEGRNIMDLKDTRGKYLIREMFRLVEAEGAGWVDYMWPKPGESVSTQKSTYVTRARMGNQSVLVGCGVYLADAPKEPALTKKMDAAELMALVREAAVIFEKNGEKAYPQFREKGTKWYKEDTYFFVWNMEGIRVFHAAEPAGEGQDVSKLKDIHDRPIGYMFLDAASTGAKEGWVHYMYPEPGDIFPTWKSTFVKGVTFPDGKPYLIGCGIYQMEINKSFVEDVVDRAAKLIAKQGKQAFPQLRDKTGPFVFMDTYVFVHDLQGTELVNAAQPSLEGRNLLDLKDLSGKEVMKEQLEAVRNAESAWLDCYWFKPGDNLPALKKTYLRKVRFGPETYVVGSGLYLSGDEGKPAGIRKVSWKDLETVDFSERLSRQMISGEKGTLARFNAKKGVGVDRHQHDNEEYVCVLSGVMKFIFDDREVLLKKGDVLIIPANVAHDIEVTEDADFFDFFIPLRSDWVRGEDQYLRKEN
ncbi:MAG TPA: cache domain-containing protein [Saprospiraceae bacterium]|nr:cache domain-containing protein [Saprospiraceae bacterium]HNT20439.1 cache domain-containing protein [Saprospiraceae bacterium]